MEDIKKALLVFDGEVQTVLKSLKLVAQDPSKWTPAVAKLAASRESNRAVLYSRICNLFETYMPPRFPPSVYLHQLHTVAVAVAAAGDYLLARDQCVARYLEGKIKWPSDVDAEDLVTVMLVSALCEFQILVAADPDLSRSETVQTIQERCCDAIMAAMQTACPPTAAIDDAGLRIQDKRYWLTFNATVTALVICKKLLSSGYASSCVQLALFCCAALESSVPLLQPAYLPWRARWYGVVCNAYHRSGSAADGVTYAKRAVQQIQTVAAAIALDPVKPTAEMQQALTAAETEAVALLVSLSCCHATADITATLTEAKAASWPAPQKFAALCSAATQGTSRLEVALASAKDGDDRPADTGAGKCVEAAYELAKPSLLEIFRHYEDAANAAAEAKPEVKAAGQAVPIAKAIALAKTAYAARRFDSFRALATSCGVRLAKIVEWHGINAADVANATAVHPVEGDVMSRDEALAHSSSLNALRSALSLQVLTIIPGGTSSLPKVYKDKNPKDPEPPLLTASEVEAISLADAAAKELIAASATADSDLLDGCAVVVCRAMQPLLPRVHASVAAWKTASEMKRKQWQERVAATARTSAPSTSGSKAKSKPTTAHGAESSKPKTPAAETNAAAESDAAAAAVSEEAKDDAIAAEERTKEDERVKSAAKGTAAADGSSCWDDELQSDTEADADDWSFEGTLKCDAPVHIQASRALVAAVNWLIKSKFADSLQVGMYAVDAVQLLLLRGRVSMAEFLASSAVACISSARFAIQKMCLPNGAFNPAHAALTAHASWSVRCGDTSASRRCYEEVEQSMASLQLDLCRLEARARLRSAVANSRVRARKAAAKRAAARALRIQRTALYGDLSKKEKRLYEEEEEADKYLPESVESRVDALVASCGSNNAERAIMLLELSALPAPLNDQRAFVSRAWDLTLAAEAYEAEGIKSLEAAFSVGKKKTHSKLTEPPPPPAVLLCGIDGVAVASTSNRSKFYAIFAKPEGSGTALSLNNVELFNSGVSYAALIPVVIGGLKRNEKYIFAVAEVGDDGKVRGGISEKSVAAVAATPLPSLSLFCLIALRAFELGDVALGTKAIQKVSSTVLLPGPAQELHLQAPFNRDSFISAAADMAPRCALRLVQRAFCAFVNVRLEKLQVENYGNGLTGTLARQLEFVSLSKQVFVAAQCAASSDDTVGVRACLSLMYRCISPLLHLSPRPLTVAHALCGCHSLSQFLQQQQQLPAPDELFMPFGHDDISRRIAAAVAYEAANVLLDNREEKAASVLCLPALKQAAEISSVLALRPHVSLPAPAAAAAAAPAAAPPAKGKGPAAPEPAAALPPPKKALPSQKPLVPAPDTFPEGRALVMWSGSVKSALIETGLKDVLASLTGGAALDAAVLSLARGQLTADIANNAVAAALKEPLHPRCVPLSVLVLRSALRSRVLRGADGSSSLFDLADKVIKQCFDTRIALQGDRKRWVASDDVPAICHGVLSSKDMTAPNKRSEFKMPGLEPSTEEQAEAAADAQAAAAAEAQRADEELQAIEIDDAEIQKRSAAAAEREQRAKARAALQDNRVDARRTAAAGQLQKLLPMFISRIRERRALRVCISYDVPWIATLNQLKALEAFDLARTAKSAALAIPEGEDNSAAREAAVAKVGDLAMRVLTYLRRCSILGARAGCMRLVTDAMATAWNTYWELKAFLGTQSSAAKAFAAIGDSICEVLDACRASMRSDENGSGVDEAALVMQSLQISSKHLRGGAKTLPRPSPAPAKIWFESPLSPEVDFAAKFVLLTGSLLDSASLPTYHVILSQKFHDVTEKQFFGREMDLLIAAAEAAALRLSSVKDSGKSLLGEPVAQVLVRLQKMRAAIARDRAKIDTLIEEMRAACRALPSVDEAPSAPSVRPKTSGSRPPSASATLISLSPAAASLQSVISQYDASISVLRYRRDTPRLVPALLELGMLHWKKGDKSKAVVAWNDAVDSAFSSLQMLQNWRRVIADLQTDRALPPALHSDSSVAAAARWDAIARAVDAPLLIAAAITCGCLSRFGYMEDEKNANEASQLAAILMSSLASGSLSHPQVPFAFATVCPKTIAPPPESRGATPAAAPSPASSTGGVLGLFLHREVADAAQLVQAAAVCGSRLLLAGQPSTALPAVVFGMHVARDVLRDVKMYAHLSVTRARLSTRMGILPAAVVDLVSLFNGRGLPDLFNDSASVIPKKAAAVPAAVDPKAKGAPPPVAQAATATLADPPAFNDAAPADSSENLPVYTWISDVAQACIAHVFDGTDTPGVSLYDSSTVVLIALTCVELLHASVPPNVVVADDAAALSSPAGRLARAASFAEKLLQKCKEGLAAAQPADATWRTAVAVRCYVFTARFKMRCGLLTGALAVVAEAVGLLNSSEAVVWGRTIADFRSMCCGSTWIELLAIRAVCLLAQGRVADAASASEAGVKHGAQCNEQRWTSVCSEVRLWADVAQGKTDAARMQCEAITTTIRNLHSFDADACLALASLSSFLARLVDKPEAGVKLIEESSSIILSHLVDYGIEASKNRYFPGMHINAMLLYSQALVECRLGSGSSSASDAAAHASSLASKGLEIVAQMPLPDWDILAQLLFARLVAVRRSLWAKHAAHNGKGHLSLPLAASAVEEAKKELFPSYPAAGELPDASAKGFISMLHQEAAPQPSLALALSDAKQLVGLLCARKPSEVGLLRDVFLEMALVAFLCDDAAKAALCLAEAASVAAFMKKQAATVLPAAKSDTPAAAPSKAAPPAKGSAPAAASAAFNLPPFVQMELDEACAQYMASRSGGDAPDPGAASAQSLFSVMSAMRREATVLPCEVASLRIMHAATIHAALIAGSPEYLSIAWPSAAASTSADSFAPDRVVSGWLHVGFGAGDSRCACLAVWSDEQQNLRVSLWSPALLTERKIIRSFVVASEVVVAPAPGQDLESVLARPHGSGGAANADSALPVLAELCPQNEKFLSAVQISQWDHLAAFFDKTTAAADSSSPSISSFFRQLVSQ